MLMSISSFFKCVNSWNNFHLNIVYCYMLHGKKSIVVPAKLFFATVKRLAGNERANEGISRIQPK